MKQKFTLIFALLFATVCIQSQVTIGSGQAPNKGALLDLKDNGAYNNGETATKGLGMPRVNLTKIKPTTPTELSASIGSTGDWDLTEHIGLIVYNAKEDLCATPILYSGLHVWDGTTWVGLGIQTGGTLAPGVYEVTDPRDNEVYLARNFGATAGDWMLENLRYDPIAHPAGFTDFTHTAAAAPPYTAKYYAYAEGGQNPYDPATHPSSEWASKKKNGLLYNWAAATNGENPSTVDQGEGSGSPNPTPENIQQVGVQGICPANWHVPSDKEWNQLEAVFAASTTDYTNSAATPFTWETSYNTTADWRPNSANVYGHGKSMKSPCPPIGSSNATTGDSKTAAAGGFNLLLAGYAHNGSAYVYGVGAYLWSSSSGSSTYAWYRYVGNGLAGVFRFAGPRYGLLSVRCKKN